MVLGGGSGVCGLWCRLSGPEEQRLLELLAYGLVALGAGSAVLLAFIPMPYGRYSSRRFGWLLPARPAWALQELPSLLLPLGLAACGGAAAAAGPNRVLLGCFVVHYAHRCGPGRGWRGGKGCHPVPSLNAELISGAGSGGPPGPLAARGTAQ